MARDGFVGCSAFQSRHRNPEYCSSPILINKPLRGVAIHVSQNDLGNSLSNLIDFLGGHLAPPLIASRTLGQPLDSHSDRSAIDHRTNRPNRAGLGALPESTSRRQCRAENPYRCPHSASSRYAGCTGFSTFFIFAFISIREQPATCRLI